MTDVVTTIAAEIYVDLSMKVNAGEITFGDAIVVLIHALARVIGCEPDPTHRRHVLMRVKETLDNASETYALLMHTKGNG